MRTAAFLFLALSFSIACNPANVALGGGSSEPCSAFGGAQYKCRDAQTLGFCGAGGRAAYEPCAQVCADLGLESVGDCGPDSARGHDFCVCSDGCCVENTRRCNSEGNLEFCRSCLFAEVDCAKICEDRNKGPQGCNIDGRTGAADCYCEGDQISVCAADNVKCAEAWLNPCGMGSRPVVVCADACAVAKSNFGDCVFDPETGVEQCKCSNTPPSVECLTAVPTCNGDKLTACVSGTVVTVNCPEECARLSLDYLGCKKDEDRGHDVCLCNFGGTPQVVVPDGDQN